MEFLEQSEKQQNSIERLVLVIYSLYVSVLCAKALKNDWPYWIPILIVVSTVACWYIFIVKYKNFQTRTLITTVIIEIGALFYGLNTDSFETVLPTLIVLTVLVGFYGIVDYMYITIVTLVIVSVNAVYFGGDKYTGIMDLQKQLMNLVILEIVLFIWLKNRQKSSGKSRQMIETLRKVEHSKDDFLANVSHEIRTPLNTILGMSEISLQETDIYKLQENLYYIQNASRNLMTTVGDILDFTELQSGELRIEEEEYDLRATIENIIDMAIAQKSEKNIELIINIDPTIPAKLFGDEKKIRRVVNNLVNNAIKFTDSGYVEISVTGRKESYGLNLNFCIKDTGIGIKPENIEKLFTTFSQLDPRRNRNEGGLGLGLAFSKMIAEKLGGFILVKSKPGQGSVLNFVVPQGVVDDDQLFVVQDPTVLKILLYINMEQFDNVDMRDAYKDNLLNLINQNGVVSQYCRNIEELKRRFDRGNFNFVIISEVEYWEDTAYFDELSLKAHLVVITERDTEKPILNESAIKLYKPVYLFGVEKLYYELMKLEKQDEKRSFTAPDYRILVVDDNKMNIKVVEGLLAQYQVKVSKALSGSEALEKVESRNYDLIFMDHMMPEMDGVETFERIRAKKGSYFMNVPIIALTANAVAGSREMFLEKGFNDFLEKPVEPSILDRVLRRNIPEDKMIFTNKKTKPENKITEQTKENVAETAVEEKIQEIKVSIEQANDAELTIKDVDVKSGLVYCCGEDNYIMIVKECCEDYSETRNHLDELLAKEDWKNYVIKIHALKGTMRSIGVNTIADLSYALEMAGKEERYDFIRENHDNTMEAYKAMMINIASHPKIDVDLGIMFKSNENEDTEDLGDITELSIEDFEQYVEKFEDAMYSLDEDVMKDIVETLKAYSLNGKPLSSSLKEVENKILKSDYFSAGEVLAQIKNS